MDTPPQDRPRCTATTAAGKRCKRRDLARLNLSWIKPGDPAGDLCLVHWRIDRARKAKARR